MTVHEIVTGRVDQRNAKGIMVAGEWRNLSKFKPLELPDVGAQVSLGLDPKGFITTLEVLEEVVSSDTTRLRRRDETITRLAVLKAASYFGASRPDLKSADVLTIAERWLEWVLR